MGNEYYTYAYLREDGSPYYIGKGKKNRIFIRSKKDVPAPKDKSRAIFLKKNLTEDEAFKHEIYMIAIFGRKDLRTGILINRTPGGDNPPKSNGKTPWNKGKKMRFSNPQERGNKISNGLKNKPKTEEHRRKVSETRKRLKIQSPNKNKFKISEEQIEELLQSENIAELAKTWGVTKNYLYGLRRDLKKRGRTSKDARRKKKTKVTSMKLTDEQIDFLMSENYKSTVELAKQWNVSKTYLYNLKYLIKKFRDAS